MSSWKMVNPEVRMANQSMLWQNCSACYQTVGYQGYSHGCRSCSS